MASVAEPELVTSVSQFQQHNNPVWDEQQEEISITDGTYDLVDLTPELDEEFELELP